MRKLTICLSLCIFLPLAIIGQETAARTSLKTIRVNDVELHYMDLGKGVPVVFVHGGLEDYRAWEAQAVAFSKDYRAIAYSRRYNYPNTNRAAGKNYSAIVDAEDLAALITKLKLPPAHIVGLSYGAYAALFLAVKHPELVRSLVLSEPPILRWLPAIDGGEPLFTEFMSKAWDPTTRGFQKSDEEGVKAAINGFGELGYSGTEEKMTYASVPPEVRSMLLEDAPEWRALTMSKDAFPDLPLSAVKGIKAPVLLLSGGRSLKLAMAIDHQLESLLPRAPRIILPAATHEMWNEYPEECRNAALRFMAHH